MSNDIIDQRILQTCLILRYQQIILGAVNLKIMIPIFQVCLKYDFAALINSYTNVFRVDFSVFSSALSIIN